MSDIPSAIFLLYCAENTCFSPGFARRSTNQPTKLGGAVRVLVGAQVASRVWPVWLLIGCPAALSASPHPVAIFCPPEPHPGGTPPFSFGSRTRPYILIHTNKQLPPHAVR
jgi:hypothetical protein